MESNKPEMYSDNRVPFLLRHGKERLVSQDASVGNQDMDTPKLLQCNFDNRFAVLSRADCGSSLSSGCLCIETCKASPDVNWTHPL